MPISLEEVRKIAKLARLKLTAEEEQKYAVQLSAILDYVDQLSDLKGVKFPTEVSMATHNAEELRPDEKDGGRHQSKILELAPTRQNNYFSVLAVFEE